MEENLVNRICITHGDTNVEVEEPFQTDCDELVRLYYSALLAAGFHPKSVAQSLISIGEEFWEGLI